MIMKKNTAIASFAIFIFTVMCSLPVMAQDENIGFHQALKTKFIEGNAGLIAFALIVVLMTALYRLPGFLACIALAGQVAATLAFVSGYFSVFESFTLTLPGIAGIILAIGMGVDANVITAERIKEELRSGKSLDGALKSGFARGLTPPSWPRYVVHRRKWRFRSGS